MNSTKKLLFMNQSIRFSNDRRLS